MKFHTLFVFCVILGITNLANASDFFSCKTKQINPDKIESKEFSIDLEYQPNNSTIVCKSAVAGELVTFCWYPHMNRVQMTTQSMEEKAGFRSSSFEMTSDQKFPNHFSLEVSTAYPTPWMQVTCQRNP